MRGLSHYILNSILANTLLCERTKKERDLDRMRPLKTIAIATGCHLIFGLGFNRRSICDAKDAVTYVDEYRIHHLFLWNGWLNARGPAVCVDFQGATEGQPHMCRRIFYGYRDYTNLNSLLDRNGSCFVLIWSGLLAKRTTGLVMRFDYKEDFCKSAIRCMRMVHKRYLLRPVYNEGRPRSWDVHSEHN